MYRPFEDLCARYSRELSGSSAAALERHPGDHADRWNARQIVEHLILTYKSTGNVLRERLQKDRPTRSRVTAKHRSAQFILLTLGYFPPGRPAPPFVTPQSTASEPLDGAGLSDRQRSEIRCMDTLLSQCEERFGGRQLATHQLLGPMSARQWRQFHVVHTRHHLKQLQALHLALSEKTKVPI